MTRIFIILIIIFSGCNIGPRNIEYEKEWDKWSDKLKELVKEIQENSANYSIGNHIFPKGFDYPFDEGFAIHHCNNGKDEPIKPDSLTIVFYTDRGLLDHYSGFIFTNNSSIIESYESKIKHQAGDYKLEENWYYISD